MMLIKPSKISVEKDTVVKNRIRELIKQKRMTFETFLEYFEEYLRLDPEIAMIIMYYANNALVKNKSITEDYRIQLITAMRDDLNTKWDIDYEKYK